MDSATTQNGNGLILSFPQLTSSKPTPGGLQQWLNEDYIPALQASKLIEGAWLYSAANPAYNKQHLIVYDLKSVADIVNGPSPFPAVQSTSKSDLFEGSIEDHVIFDTRVYSFHQDYNKGSVDAGSSLFSSSLHNRRLQRI